MKGAYEFARSRGRELGNQAVLRLIWVQDEHPGWMLYGRDRKPREGEESEGEVARGAVPVRHGIPKGFLEEVDVLKGQEKGSRIQRKRHIPRRLKLRDQSLTRDEEDGEWSGAGQRQRAGCTEKGLSACPRSVLFVPCAATGHSLQALHCLAPPWCSDDLSCQRERKHVCWGKHPTPGKARP